MSTLEKFGILVILILVVIIGVVAVWGVGGEGKNPFSAGDGSGTVASAEPGADTPAGPVDPALSAPAWPGSGSAAPSVPGSAPVAPPAIAAGPTSPVPPPSSVKDAPRDPAPSSRTYTVQKGDTLAGIARKTLGSDAKWVAIRDANPGLDPRKLKIGMVLNIPGDSGAAVALTDATPKLPKPNTFVPNRADGPTEMTAPATGAGGMREVTVEKGDTFYTLSTRYLGNANLYYKIAKANPDIDPRKLRPGMKVRIPAE